ncbi:ribonuclease P protein component [Leucobacter luti]|uniref:Ribonuclease P protein component n=1 Tax=Leucobacter luti TaxID=340320 RepID=A0A4R6S1Z2_9MICO|nr:ribonuclease P protein component [Leucobacter luti]QYM77370.1 ribonuclease P protein component [Leucobacter luti]TCK39897.1 ribonuclease P protein component [Leucobacter luti]TDP93244.1 ribonuclease P protein component [Leucobacter luti]
MPALRHRVTRGDDYRRVVRSGYRVGGAHCITHAVLRAPGEPARFGFIVSKAVGNAVHRNLVRRRLKTIAERRIAAGLGGVDIVFRALPAIRDTRFADLEAEIGRALDRVERTLQPVAGVR